MQSGWTAALVAERTPAPYTHPKYMDIPEGQSNE